MKYFSLDEFRCKHCGKLPQKGMSPVLVAKLEHLRDKIGQPIYVSSGYRCPYHNVEVGGVPNSQHIYGTAADIYCEDMTISQLVRFVEEIGFDGIGVYDNFVHVDCRDDGWSANEYRW